MINLYKILFFNLLLVSSFISISAISWFTAWMGLEMNLLAIIPLMKTLKNKFAAEAAIKYFIIQAMASSFLLLSIILIPYFNQVYFKMYTFPSLILNSALILKMGAAPLHFWLPEIISGLEWSTIFMILTWQKIAPMILLSYCIFSSKFLSTIAILSSMLSGIQGINQICLRKIMAFSSINHMGWMICTLLSSTTLWLFYFLIYCISSGNLLYIFNKFNTFFYNQLNKMSFFSKKLKFFFMLNFLSLGGLPPFIGFAPKWLTINYLMNQNYMILSFFMVILTLITLYFYTRMTFSSFTLKSSESFTLSTPKNMNFWFFFLNFTFLASLPLFFAFSNIF